MQFDNINQHFDFQATHSPEKLSGETGLIHVKAGLL
jgi:hypothetical protein